MSELLGHYIDGHIITNKGGECQAIFNPAIGEAVRNVVFADAQIVDQAVVSAQAAFSAWASTPVSRRVNILFKFRQLLEQHIEEIAALVTEEHGKTLADARASIMRGIEIVEVSCGIANQLQGTFSANVSRQVDCYTLRQPLGVCVGVSPFNFPVMIPLWLAVP
ncbi:MAG: aldehyde dehydrogenase family protein, partial [Gammaproteobacteria bacterium]